MVGVYAPGLQVAHLTALGLHALQHRGQESAGIAVSDGAQLSLHKRLGLVGQVFDEETLARLEADQDGLAGGHAARLAIGHTRYSTTGSNSLPNVQPVYAESELGELMLGHNGNLTNATWLRDALTEQGVEFVTASDTEVLAKLIAHAPGRSWAQRVEHAFHRAAGAYTFTMLTPRALVAARDPIGFRPLALGRLHDAEGRAAGWAVASESVALDAMGATFVRDVEAGEILTIDEDGVHAVAAGGQRRGERRARAAVRLRVRLPGAARQRDRRAAAVRGAAADGPAAGDRAAGRGRPGDPGARLRDPRRHRLRRAVRAARSARG